MAMITTTVAGFEVISADGDGHGESHVAYFNNEKAAKQLAAQSPGWLRVQKFEKTFQICSTFGEYVQLKNEEIKVRALAKLSKEEREALGV
jgi:hypothetical protein